MWRQSASRPIPNLVTMESKLAPAMRVASIRARSACRQIVQGGPLRDEVRLGRWVEAMGLPGCVPDGVPVVIKT